MEKMAISGATSSLGIALIEECIKNKKKVLAFVNPESKNIGRIPVHNNIKVIKCDISEMVNLQTDGEKADVFVHFAWASTHGNSERSNIKAQIDNIQYSVDAVNLAERLGCRTFIGAGSQAEYGRTYETLTEDLACRPETPYGAAKFCAGQMTRLECEKKGINHIWTRILSSYGPNYILNTVLNYTIIELLNNRIPKLTDCKQIWDFIYSGDVARAFYLMAEKVDSSRVYVVGSGISRPLKDYICEIRNIINPDMKLGFGIIPYNENSVMCLKCDISKLKSDTGFQIETSFDDGIKNTIEWVKKQNITERTGY